MGDGVLDGLLGDLVKLDALQPLAGNIQNLRQMPGDRFSLAVGVGAR